MTPNIVKGTGIAGAIRYCRGEGNAPGAGPESIGARIHLAPGDKSRATLLGGVNFGFAVDDGRTLQLATDIMEWNGLPKNQASKTRPCRQDCFHASLSWEPGEKPSDAVKMAAAKSFMKALGMESAQYVVYAHNDKPYDHIHIVASRIHPETGRTFSEKRDFATAQAWALKYERDHGHIPEAKRQTHGIAGAIIAGDREAIFGHLTEKNPTFTIKQLDRVISYGGLTPELAYKLRNDVLADREVIGLRSAADAPIDRYTTRTVLSQERALQADAKELARSKGYGVSMEAQAAAAIAHGLKPEQAQALHHVSGDGGFAMIAGQAGTGKSTTLRAVREAHEADGYRVVGLGPTNKVKLALAANGFDHAATVSMELGLNSRNGKPAPAAAWNRSTIVVLDEAAMLSTKDLGAVMRRAQESGAKLIMAGDGAQLGSIERGGMFEPLRNEHGAAEINEVHRVNKAELKTAYNLAHDGKFRPALDIFAAENMLRWSSNARQAEAELVERYTADVKAAPDKSRFIFAHTNESVDRLNAAARGLARDGGRLGPDHTLETATGGGDFATGDRIQFTATARSPTMRDAGFANGATGTVTEIAAERGRVTMTVALDTGAELRFKVGSDRGAFDGFRHGYAGTVHKGQGDSIDQTYLLVSKGWQAQLSYVALTRFKETMAVFIPKEVAADLAALATVMGRAGTGAAASSFKIDEASLMRSGLTFQAAGGQGDGIKPAPVAPAPAASVSRGPKVSLGAAQEARGAAASKGRASETPQAAKPASAPAGKPDKAAAAAKVLDGVANTVAKTFDVVADIFESILAPAAPLTVEQQIEARKSAEAKHQAAQERERREGPEFVSQPRQKPQRMTPAEQEMRDFLADFAGETENQRMNRIAREEREIEDDRGRQRGG